MSLDINKLVSDAYTTFSGDLLTALGTDSKELLQTGAIYVTDAKASFLAIGNAALDPTNPMSWKEVKTKLLQEGVIAKSAFQSVEQLIAGDFQSFINNIIASFENLLSNALVQLQQTP